MLRLRTLVIAVQIAASLTGAALAVDRPILGKQMVVKNPHPAGDELRRSVVVLGRESATDIPSVSNPTIGGATLRIVIMGGAASDQTYVLDAAGWSAISSGYRYLGPTSPDNDPVKKVILRRTPGGVTLLKVIVRGNVGTQSLDVVPPNGGDVGGAVLSVSGGDSYCVTFGGPAGGSETADDASQWKISDATAQACIGPCPTSLRLDRTLGLSDLDLGWSGHMHDAEAVSLGRLTVGVGACAGASRPLCGTCALSGPLPNAGGAAFSNRRCTGNTRTQCTTTADCFGVGGTCEYFLGPPQPLPGAGLPVCIVNQIVGAITGAADVEAGTLSIPLGLQARWHLGSTIAAPCPRCVSGVCSGGLNNGLSCTTGSVSAFGEVSLDCPPASPVGVTPVSVTLSTGTQIRSLSSTSPNCRAAGSTSLKCLCDTCNDGGASPCSSNADCVAVGATICGAGGSGSGVPTRPNNCDDLTCVDNTPPDDDSVDEGLCAAGPSESFCAIQTFRPCATGADCPASGDTCTGSALRQCFTDNGPLGGDIVSSGATAPPTGVTFNPTVAGLFCQSPTTSFSVNATAGLPAPGRITARLTATYDQ